MPTRFNQKLNQKLNQEAQQQDCILLDCTLRDGGYPIHFQFSMSDVKRICGGLEAAGISKIEVGHGLGLGASGVEHGVAFESDEDYIKAAKASVATAAIGAFFIPNIGSFEDISKAHAAGLDFIRIGVNVTDIAEAQDYCSHAKALGLEVHVNLMKSYALPVETFGEVAKQIAGWGIDIIYVVDSSGCMLPSEVSRYVQAVLATGTKAGFHGHNNLDLVNANCLAAMEAGALLVDGTLRGMGRSSGNAQTEVLAHLINRQSNTERYRIFDLLQTIEQAVEPLMITLQGQPSLDVITGISRFHSGFLPRFKRVQGRYEVNLNRLIYEVSKIDCVNPSEQLIESVAKDLVRLDG
jgi:4-hydroxy-2-oxovalerate aldolase